MDEKIIWIWLSRLRMISTEYIARLKMLFGSYEKIWTADSKELKSRGVTNDRLVEEMLDKNVKNECQEIAKKCRENNIDILFHTGREFPELLKCIPSPPKIIYVKGNPCWHKKNLGIVGSRKSSSYGQMTAHRLAYDASVLGYTIISGMARGIDTCAHAGALKAKGKTIAVLGCGVDICYPKENAKIFEELLENGAVISEYPPGTQPKAQHFPARNRIISGLSAGVIIVEAGHQSGSLITANFALEQGRQVFAVPGDADKERSYGTNQLLKDGAYIVTGIEDVLPYLDMDYCISYNTPKEPVFKEYIDTLSNGDREVLNALKLEDMDMDRLSYRLDIPVNEINSQLSILELHGIIMRSDNGKYRLI